MPDTQHMRLSGHDEPFLLTTDAYDRLLDYIARCRERLGFGPDADETLRDIEASLGDRLRTLAGPSGAALLDDQMAAMLHDFGDVEPDAARTRQPDGASRGRFWCRIDEGRWFAGICVGIAARGHLRLDWVRTIGILLMLVTGGLIGIVYLALVLILPRASTVAEYDRLADAPAAPKRGPRV